MLSVRLCVRSPPEWPPLHVRLGSLYHFFSVDKKPSCCDPRYQRPAARADRSNLSFSRHRFFVSLFAPSATCRRDGSMWPSWKRLGTGAPRSSSSPGELGTNRLISSSQWCRTGGVWSLRYSVYLICVLFCGPGSLRLSCLADAVCGNSFFAQRFHGAWYPALCCAGVSVC